MFILVIFSLQFGAEAWFRINASPKLAYPLSSLSPACSNVAAFYPATTQTTSSQGSTATPARSRYLLVPCAEQSSAHQKGTRMTPHRQALSTTRNQPPGPAGRVATTPVLDSGMAAPSSNPCSPPLETNTNSAPRRTRRPRYTSNDAMKRRRCHRLGSRRSTTRGTRSTFEQRLCSIIFHESRNSLPSRGRHLVQKAHVLTRRCITLGVKHPG